MPVALQIPLYNCLSIPPDWYTAFMPLVFHVFDSTEFDPLIPRGCTFLAFLTAIYVYVQHRRVSRITVKVLVHTSPVIPCGISSTLGALFSLLAFAIDAGVIG